VSDDLLIKISADTKDVKQAYDDVKAKTEDLEGALSEIAKVSGVAFAALSAQVAVSVKAFSDANNASLELSNALQNQGIYTDQLKESYKAYAEEVSAVTGISTTQITQAQAVAQTYLGQVPVTKQLTQAIADLAQAQGISLPSAAEQLGKAIGTGTGMLLRQGLQISATSTEAQRYAQVLDFVNGKYGGAASAIDPVTLATKKLATAFEESEVELGSRFAPAVASVIETITSFIQPSKDANSSLVDLKASLIVAGLAITAVGVALPIMANAFLVVRAAMIALNTQLTLTQALLAGLGIGLISIALTELVLHFNQVKAVVQSFIADLAQLANVAKGVGSILQGAFTFDASKIKQGLADIAAAFSKIGTDAKTAWTEANEATEKGAETQDATKKKFADKAAADRAAQDANRRALDKAEQDYTLLQLQNASQAAIELKKQEIETLKALGSKQSAEEKQLLQERLAQIRQDEKTQNEEDLQIQKQFDQQQEAAAKQHGVGMETIRTQADKKEIADIKKNTETQEKAKKKVFEDDLKYEQAQHNRFLEEQVKYGTAYAAIDEAMHSTVYQGTKSAFGDLAQLQTSSNSTLKEIGKVASIANIVIKTAESAMNIYAGFSTIPIVGPALGIAGAAAAVAFGAEQVGKVSAAATGGAVAGPGYGDSQPFLLEPGELIAPRQNFNEVVDSVAQSRGYTKDDGSEGGTQNVGVQIGFDGRSAQQVLTAQIVEAKAIGTYRASS